MSGGRHLYGQTRRSVGQHLPTGWDWEMLAGGTKPPFLQKVRADPHLELSGAALRMGGPRREALSIAAPQPLSSRRFPLSPRSSQPWQA